MFYKHILLVLKGYRYLHAYYEYCEVNVKGAYILI